MIYEIETEDTADTKLDADIILADYRLAWMSRQASLIGRREVLSGKAKFGIFGDGKELPQIALAKVFRPGDFRSGYYRDQTLMLALGQTTVEQLFAQLYAHADVAAEPNMAGRSMNAHFATRLLDESGHWRDQLAQPNTSADVSPTGSQMPRLVGLGYASRLYRHLEDLHSYTRFSDHGNEVAFGTIGNASTAEGLFWEAVNAIGVLQAPVVLSIWDDEYGISVPNEYQMTKGNISALLSGFQREEGTQDGFDIYVVPGWDYPALRRTYERAATIARQQHIPAIVHVIELTQPQGHSTSGSHERYKSEERLAWEEEHDCLAKMRAWMLQEGLATAEQLDDLEYDVKEEVEEIRLKAWRAYISPIREDRQAVADILEQGCGNSEEQTKALAKLRRQLLNQPTPWRRDIMRTLRDALIVLRHDDSPCRQQLVRWKERLDEAGRQRYSTHLYSQSGQAATHVEEVAPVYSADSPRVAGFKILNAAFDAMLARDPRVIAFGEDVGELGDVNQGMAGLQEQYGRLRVSDTGIREATIVGQAIGMALRGLRPLAEIQYLDYVLYALQIMSDDLATLHWRTRGGQKAPVILRTRGHRLEGIWHSGSLMAGIIHLVRGMHVLVPRNMTQAAGFYNTLLLGDEPGLVVEVLNGYRVKERLPDNIDQMTVPLGVPEVIRAGDDLTLVTYGALCRIAQQAADLLNDVGIEIEIIDVRSLLPFDRPNIILHSLQKTGRILFVDEDVPGGTSAYMMDEVIQKRGGFWWLDGEPHTLTSQPHRPAYGSDGDYWSKPNATDIFERVYEIMNEVDPARYPIFFRADAD
ncbi:MAG: thiamine pyrophosphate-dependent enzyme [Candidatus Promineifilaceae bacterium]|nr:thiamine pyrophosphate-dependent enzyme [Candidatus Promineifilaceae bacterium]